MSEKKEKKEIDFNLVEVKEKPNRAYKKGSKYDPLINAFLGSKSVLVNVEMKNEDGEMLDANYLRTQINKRIVAKKLPMKVSVTNNAVYLEKELKVEVKKVKT
jgi:hypothetical protein